MNKNQIISPKTYKYAIYGFIALTIIMLLLLLASCDSQPVQPSYAQQQVPVQQPIQYDNDVNYHSDNTAARLAAAAAVGVAAGYATSKYVDKQKQKQVSTPASVKVNLSTVQATKPIISKPSFSYLTSKSSNPSRSTSIKSTRRK